MVEKSSGRANGVKTAPGYVFFLICNAILRFYRAAVGINKEIFSAFNNIRNETAPEIIQPTDCKRGINI